MIKYHPPQMVDPLILEECRIAFQTTNDKVIVGEYTFDLALMFDVDDYDLTFGTDHHSYKVPVYYRDCYFEGYIEFQDLTAEAVHGAIDLWITARVINS